VVIPLIDCSPFYDRDASQKPWLWFNESVNWLQDLRTFIGQWKGFAASHNVRNGVTLAKLATYARQLVSTWETFLKGNAEQRCFLFSAFLFGLAEMQFSLGNNVVSLLCLHRAADVYLQYCGLAEGIIIQTPAGLRYDHTVCTELVSILNSLNTLESLGHLAPDSARYRTLKGLNEERNKLLLTHGVYGVNRDSLKDYIREVELLIRRIEGTSKWSRTRDAWFPLPSIDRKVLFELETSMDSYLKEINVG
jgi:hypothetical protein